MTLFKRLTSWVYLKNINLFYSRTLSAALATDKLGCILPSASHVPSCVCVTRTHTRHAVPAPQLVGAAGEPPRDTLFPPRYWSALPGNLLVTRSRYKYAEPRAHRAALVCEGRCFVSAGRLSPRSLPTPASPLRRGNTSAVQDNTIKAGRVLADSGLNLAHDCRKHAPV